MLRVRRVAGSVAALSILLILAVIAEAQPPAGETKPAPTTPAPVPTVPGPAEPGKEKKEKEEEVEAPKAERAGEPFRVPEELFPTIRTPTIVGPNLFNPPAPQGWLTFTPSFTLSGEYNDNIGLSATNRQTDGIIGFTPGLTISAQRRGFTLFVGYNTTGEIFIENSENNDFGKEQQFIGNMSYQITPRLSLNVADGFVFGRQSSSLTSGGVSVGFQEGFRNTLTPSLRYQLRPGTGLDLVGSYTLLRFTGSGTGQDSDTVRGAVGIDHQLTQRLTVLGTAAVGYIRTKGEPESWTYTPSAGFSYQITPTLTASVLGGATFLDRDNDVSVSPAVAAGLTQVFKWGTVQVGYDQAITAETIGVTDRKAVFASVVAPTLMRGLSLEFAPRYVIADEEDTTNNASSTVKTLTVTLRATYQIARSISLIGSYTFFKQWSDQSRNDIDQNRVFLGVQYAFPINFY